MNSCKTEIKQLSVENILTKTIDHSGQHFLAKAKLEYTIDASYTATQNEHIYAYEIKQLREGVNYFAKSYNGGFEYTENGEPSTYAYLIWETKKRLYFIHNFMRFHSVFEQDNSVELYQEGVEKIGDRSYYVLHAYNKNQLPTDIIINYHFYINTSTFKLDYIGHDTNLGDNLFHFRKLVNKRRVKDVLFSDYEHL